MAPGRLPAGVGSPLQMGHLIRVLYRDYLQKGGEHIGTHKGSFPRAGANEAVIPQRGRGEEEGDRRTPLPVVVGGHGLYDIVLQGGSWGINTSTSPSFTLPPVTSSLHRSDQLEAKIQGEGGKKERQVLSSQSQVLLPCPLPYTCTGSAGPLSAQ